MARPSEHFAAKQASWPDQEHEKQDDEGAEHLIFATDDEDGKLSTTPMINPPTIAPLTRRHHQEWLQQTLEAKFPSPSWP